MKEANNRNYYKTLCDPTKKQNYDDELVRIKQGDLSRAQQQLISEAQQTQAAFLAEHKAISSKIQELERAVIESPRDKSMLEKRILDLCNNQNRLMENLSELKDFQSISNKEENNRCEGNEHSSDESKEVDNKVLDKTKDFSQVLSKTSKDDDVLSFQNNSKEKFSHEESLHKRQKISENEYNKR